MLIIRAAVGLYRTQRTVNNYSCVRLAGWAGAREALNDTVRGRTP